MTNETYDSPAADLRVAVMRLARRIRRQRAEADLPDAQYSVLVTLLHHGSLTLTALAQHEGVSAPSMNRTVTCLEERGHLTRQGDPADRRRVVVALTGQGSDLIGETRRRRDAWLRQALDDLDADERAVLEAATPVLRKVAER